MMKIVALEQTLSPDIDIDHHQAIGEQEHGNVTVGTGEDYPAQQHQTEGT